MLITVGDDGRPMLACDSPYDQPTRFIGSAGRNLDQHVVQPQQLRIDEINAVFSSIGIAFYGVEREFHGTPSASLMWYRKYTIIALSAKRLSGETGGAVLEWNDGKHTNRCRSVHFRGGRDGPII